MINLKYKLVALDLDGTLLNSQGQLPEKHVEIVREAEEAGVTIVIATGRYFMQTEWIIDQLEYKGVLVSNDGAATIKTDTKELIDEFSYSIHELEPLIRYCRKHRIHFSVCTAYDYFVELLYDHQAEIHKQHEIRHTFHDDVLQLKENVMKFTISDNRKVSGWQEIECANLRRKVDNPFFKEYIHPESSKTSSLKKVMKQLNILPSEMIAIGDYYNDLDMLEYAGLGIAMGNAPEDVKRIANDVTLSNDEDGVYHALKKHF
ncbi:Cof-type HAD-IIB family hydrolase [Alteribacter populi]|uniref:Cof-type HAD-IIB family hydrolase n=1 Tax=Alteribacter populi TaxID=2011011 RepID=UPI0012FF880D|nr:Cof-type HAD-IIB family hydrolase [Alteribacter populi]